MPNTTTKTDENTLQTPLSPKPPYNPSPKPSLNQLLTTPKKPATPNVVQASTGISSSPTQNAQKPVSAVGDNNVTRSVFKQADNPIVGIRDFTAGKGYANAVDWDGEHVSIGGQIVKPMYIKNGTAYTDTNSVLDAIKAYENENGIITNKGVLDRYKTEIQPHYEAAMNKLINRKPYNWDSEKDEALQNYIAFNRKQADNALRSVLEANNTSINGASGAVMAQAMAARDEYLDKLNAEYKDFEQRNYDRYLDNYDMLQNDLDNITNLANDYYDKMYTANRDIIDDTQYAGQTEREDQQRWFENDIITQEQNRAERELAIQELLTPLEAERMRISNAGLGLDNEAKGIQNIGLGLDNESRGLQNIGLGLDNEARGLQNIGLGLDNEAKGLQNTGLGLDNEAKGLQNTGLGLDNEAKGLQNTGLGLDNEAKGIQNIGLGLDNEAKGLQNIGLGLENDSMREANRSTILQNREDEAVRRGFWLPEDEEYFPWLSKYRNADGTYSIAPYYGEAMYNYIVNGLTNQATANPYMMSGAMNSLIGASNLIQPGVYSSLVSQMLGGSFNPLLNAFMFNTNPYTNPLQSSNNKEGSIGKKTTP